MVHPWITEMAAREHAELYAERPYRWKITKDHLAEEFDNKDSDAGTEGPFGLDPTITANPQHFSMYDDDGECYYEGMLYGDDVSGFEPLEDFGTPNAGCVGIKYKGEFL